MAPSKGKKKKGRTTLKDHILIFEKEKKRMAKMYETSTKLWEMKLKRTKKDLAFHQQELYKKACETEQVKSAIFMVENCGIGVTDFWLNELKERDEKLKVMGERLKKQEEIAAQQKLELENERKRDLKRFEEEILKRKATEARVQRKITNIRKQMQVSKEEYRKSIREKEKRYSVLLKDSQEKEWNFIRKEGETNKLRAEQDKNIAELESELFSVKRERNWLIENLKSALIDLDDVNQLAESLSIDKFSLAMGKNILAIKLERSFCEMACVQQMLDEVTARAAPLEEALKKMEEEKTENEKRNQVAIQASQVELDKLQKIIAMREKEICQVKQLARTIVEKRRDMEVFFHQALDDVRQEIADERKRNAKEAYRNYYQKFRDGGKGKGKFPLIHTFDQTPNSTNSVYSDMKETGNWPHGPGKEVYMSDLTWEQKEKVLTLLFAKMNGDAERASKSSTTRLDCHFRSADWLHHHGPKEGGFVKVL
ncbi:basal body-orientation factor 1-like [Xiphophorus maculatus]|uniref:basal body-orientation factor 1-like n=1 Tax=Xiphophorus maculatus TaxID=8083 RepID=UPI0003B49B59|nr:basal body-orientation factor 1-like [Xiphophorus maculatus]